jgi:hypothetical protein
LLVIAGMAVGAFFLFRKNGMKGLERPEATQANTIVLVKYWRKVALGNSERFGFQERFLQSVAILAAALTASLPTSFPRLMPVPLAIAALAGGLLLLLKRNECYVSAHRTFMALTLELEQYHLETGKYSCQSPECQKAFARGEDYAQIKLGLLREAYSSIMLEDAKEWERIARSRGKK